MYREEVKEKKQRARNRKIQRYALIGLATVGGGTLIGTMTSLLARDSIYAIARYMPSPVRPSVCLSLCPSVCHMGGSVKDGYS